MLLKKTWKKTVLMMVSIACLMMVGCDSKQDAAKSNGGERVITVKKKPNVVKLFYSGVIQPVRVYTVTSPVEGVVNSVDFRYGQIVKKDQRLLTLSSRKLEEQFHEAVKTFLKAKDQYLNSKVSFDGAKELYKSRIISRQEFTNEKSQHQSNELAFVDARFKLEQVLETVPGVDETLEKISLRDVNKIKEIFEGHLDNIPVDAINAGIVLFPVEKRSKDDSGGGEVEVGTELKMGQAIVSIGDLSGISVEFNVGEIDINRIKPEQKVVLSIAALNRGKLDGIVKIVGVQAKKEGRSGESAQFPVRVEVPKISDKHRQHLRVGMTAKIEVDLIGEPVIMLPIPAVSTVNGKHSVTVLTDSGKHEQREVITGRTTLKDVTIIRGLKPGEKVIIND